MYFLFGILFLLCFFFFLLQMHRRRCIIRRVRCMNPCEKLCILNDLLSSFGFSYHPAQDIVTSCLDAWQREFGYRTLFDRTAPRFGMVFDREPFYFDYDGATWRIEFWKGQYGLNTGAEIGIYRADKILTPDQYNTALFRSIGDGQLLQLSMQLSRCGETLFFTRQKHWWLTGFRIGTFSEPDDLKLYLSIKFPNHAMLQSFLDSLRRSGYSSDSFCASALTAAVSFTVPHAKQFRGLRARFAQFCNCLTVKLYCLITRPFTATCDRLLYLYYFLPPVFRRILRFCKNRRQHGKIWSKSGKECP